MTSTIDNGTGTEIFYDFFVAMTKVNIEAIKMLPFWV